MDYQPSPAEVGEFIHDFAQDFGVTVGYEDASRILALHEELCDLLMKYSDEEPIPPHLVFG